MVLHFELFTYLIFCSFPQKRNANNNSPGHCRTCQHSSRRNNYTKILSGKNRSILLSCCTVASALVFVGKISGGKRKVEKSAWEERATIFARSVYLGSFKQIFLIGYDLMRLASTCRLYTFCILFNIYIFFFWIFYLICCWWTHSIWSFWGNARTHAQTTLTHTWTRGSCHRGNWSIYFLWIFFDFSCFGSFFFTH